MICSKSNIRRNYFYSRVLIVFSYIIHFKWSNAFFNIIIFFLIFAMMKTNLLVCSINYFHSDFVLIIYATGSFLLLVFNLNVYLLKVNCRFIIYLNWLFWLIN